MQGNSPRVVSNQIGPHEDLEALLRKHEYSDYRKPISEHTFAAFKKTRKVVEKLKQPLIFDSGCGTGESTIYLAGQYPSHIVIGIEKSELRLRKAGRNPQLENMLFVRADQFDFWRCAAEAGWRVDAHYLFYPNPWPRKSHLSRRIHGHPAFYSFLAISGYIQLRSNWKIYVDEFAIALRAAANRASSLAVVEAAEPVTLFEKKYMSSGHALYGLGSPSTENSVWN